MPLHRLWNVRRAASHCGVGLVLVSSLLGPGANAQSKRPLPEDARAVLDRFAGTWDVTLTVRKPQPAVLTYAFSNVWVLDRHFLRGDTGVRPDGSQELSMFTYDQAARTYPLWVFYSSGLVAYLQHGEWNESTRTMSWKSGATDSIRFRSQCSFEGAALLRCSTQVAGGPGATGVDLESVARRR